MGDILRQTVFGMSTGSNGIHSDNLLLNSPLALQRSLFFVTYANLHVREVLSWP